MRLSKRAFGVVAAVAVAAAAVTAVQVAAADPAAAVDWKPCEGAETGIECGSITVPVDHTDPDGEKLTIALSKRPATDPDARIGSLLIDGVDMVKEDGIGSQRMRERFDLIGFDPRGNKNSTNIECDSADLEAVTAIGVPTDEASFEQRAEANRELAEGCRERTGQLFDHADNLHIVEDIESVRKALGGEKLNFMGYSHGTLMGQQYAQKYPHNIRSMVLDGNMDHSLEGPWEYAASETAAVERNFDAFAAWCDATKDCALYGENTAEVYGELRDAARSGELTDPGTGAAIGFHDFARRTAPVNQPQTWPELATDLKTIRDGTGELSLDAPAEPEPIVYAMQSICTNWNMTFADYGEWEDMSARLAAEYPHTQWSPFVDLLATCLGDPVATTNPPAPLDIDDDAPPLVMIGNRNDFATVYEWSVTAAKQSGATLITYEGYGHTIYGTGNDCVDAPVENYFIDRTAPDEGISCEPRDRV